MVDRIHHALGEGRLDLDETEMRTAAAYAARYRSDLPRRRSASAALLTLLALRWIAVCAVLGAVVVARERLLHAFERR